MSCFPTPPAIKIEKTWFAKAVGAPKHLFPPAKRKLADLYPEATGPMIRPTVLDSSSKSSWPFWRGRVVESHDLSMRIVQRYLLKPRKILDCLNRVLAAWHHRFHFFVPYFPACSGSCRHTLSGCCWSWRRLEKQKWHNFNFPTRSKMFPWHDGPKRWKGPRESVRASKPTCW